MSHFYLWGKTSIIVNYYTAHARWLYLPLTSQATCPWLTKELGFPAPNWKSACAETALCHGLHHIESTNAIQLRHFKLFRVISMLFENFVHCALCKLKLLLLVASMRFCDIVVARVTWPIGTKMASAMTVLEISWLNNKILAVITDRCWHDRAARIVYHSRNEPKQDTWSVIYW